MDQNPSLQKYFEKLSEELRSPESDLLDILPNGIRNCSDKDVLAFLENHSHLLFKNTFCFRPRMAYTLVQPHAQGDYLCLIRKLSGSNMALAIWLLRLKSQSQNEFFSKITYQLTITEFDLIKSVGHINNFRLLKKENCRLVNCQDIFEGNYSKKPYPVLIREIAERLPNGKARIIRRKIFEELERLEKEIGWFIEQRLATIK